MRRRQRRMILSGGLATLLIAIPALCVNADVIQQAGVRIHFNGSLTPRSLPRTGLAPVRVSVSAKIAAIDAKTPPQLRAITIAINRNGHFNTAGLPVCTLREIQPSSTAGALAACRRSLVGEGHFTAKVLLSAQPPFPSAGKVYAFNSRLHGRPAILAHVYGTKPIPTSFTLPFTLQSSKGTFGTVLKSSLPAVVGNSGYITSLSLNLGTSFKVQGEPRSYLTAGCPAPKGLPEAVFPFSKASFVFAGGAKLTSVITRSCRAGQG
jgi:hypothetical protein